MSSEVLARDARNAKIIGGTIAELGEFPHQVALSYNDDFICGGSILSTLLILTASHCLKYKRPNRLQVIAGVHEQRNVSNERTEFLSSSGSLQIRTARYIYMHENYVWDTDINDIALIVLSSPLQFTSQIRSIDLPRKNEDLKGYATVSGWGRTEEKGKASEHLRKVKIPIVSMEECRRRYKKVRGDSGGPLICRRNDSSLVQCGVVSFGHGCGRVGFPGIYTRLANYIDWIENTKKKITARGKCRTGDYFCSSGPGCIPRAFLCDLESDCSDGEDERGCIYMTSCRRGQFRCNNGRCIKKDYTCDDMDDCGDRSDEDKCPTESKVCGIGQHQCGIGGRCIPEEWKCDSMLDCENNSDEENCDFGSAENEIVPPLVSTTTPSPCSSEQFYCTRDFRCIPLRWRCDGDRDCRSGMDELGCEDDNSSSYNNTTTTTATTQRPLTTRPAVVTSRPTTFTLSSTTTTKEPTRTTPYSSPIPMVTDSSSLSTSSTNFSCPRDQFHCGDGQCISNVFECDYDTDCDNGKDEENCEMMENTCTPYFWRCGNGQCVYHRFLCDGDFDCVDGTDETNCELSNNNSSSSSSGNTTKSPDNNSRRRENRRRRSRG